MKKTVLMTVAAAILILATAGLYYMRDYFGPGIKQCPEAWYEDRMPSDLSLGARQEFIVEGERRRVDDFNMKWIQIHCEVNKPDISS